MQPFLTLLQVQRTRSNLTLQELAEKLKLKSHSYVAEVLTGKRKLPISNVEEWADALGFSDQERIDLYRSAINDLAPAWFRDIVMRSEQKIILLEAKVREFEATIVQDWIKRRAAEDQQSG